MVAQALAKIRRWLRCMQVFERFGLLMALMKYIYAISHG
jgi:hypothetical protein